MTNKTPDNLNAIQKLVIAAEDFFNRILPGTKNKYSEEMHNTVNAQTSLPPLPSDDTDELATLEKIHTEFKISTPAENSEVKTAVSPTLPGFVEVGNAQNTLEAKNAEKTPLSIEDIRRIRAANRGVLATNPIETQRVPNPNSNTADILSA